MPDDLARARANKAHLERAAAAKQSEIERLQGQKTQGEPQAPSRSTSAAKHYDPDALSRARAAKEQFQRAAAGEQKTADRVQQQGKDKAPAHAPSAQPHLRPAPSPIRRAVDRQTFRSEQQRLDEVERAKRNQQHLLQQEKTSPQPSHDREK